MNLPCQFFASSRFLRVPFNRRSSDVLFEPIQLGLKIFELLFDIFGVLEVSGSATRNNHSLNQYLIVFDQRIYAAEGRLEGREPVG